MVDLPIDVVDHAHVRRDVILRGRPVDYLRQLVQFLHNLEGRLDLEELGRVQELALEFFVEVLLGGGQVGEVLFLRQVDEVEVVVVFGARDQALDGTLLFLLNRFRPLVAEPKVGQHVPLI